MIEAKRGARDLCGDGLMRTTNHLGSYIWRAKTWLRLNTRGHESAINTFSHIDALASAQSACGG